MKKPIFGKDDLRVLFFLFITLFFTISLSSCGGSKLEPEEKNPVVFSTPSPTDDDNYLGQVFIDLTAAPELSIDPRFDTTEIILQFIARNENDFPLTPNQVNVSLFIDNKEIDAEALIRNSSQQLAFNVNFGLVLDTSLSMLISHESDAFTPMLESAKNSIQKGIDIWSDQEGRFSFHTTWFNSSIYSSVNSASQQWTPEDITFIPEPKSGDFTRLFSATEYAIERMSSETNNEDTGVRDQNIILVFSDGVDNLSYFDGDKNDDDIALTTDNDADYIKVGHAATDLSDLVETINSHDNLSVHVIGLGDKVNIDDLQSIANAGNGLYLQNPGVEDIDKPFQRVIQEFTTLQTHGANTPLRPGEYTFTLRVENKAGNQKSEYSFRFKTGDGIAEIIPE